MTTKSMERVNTPGPMEMELKSRRSLENGKTMYLLGHGDNDDIKFEVYESFLFLKKLEFFNFKLNIFINYTQILTVKIIRKLINSNHMKKTIFYT